MAMEIFRLVGSIFVDNEKANKSISQTDKKAQGVGQKFLNATKTAGKWAAGVGTAAVAVGAAMVAVTEQTREYRTEQGKLTTAFEDNSFSAKAARDTYVELNGILGDSGQSVEAANHLAKLCNTEKDLSTWTNICAGVYGTFGDSLPIENLTEAANETAKTATLTGGLADALNWAGVNEEQFQEKLDKCRTEQERQALITTTLNGLYSDAANKYKEVNGAIIGANKAQDSMAASMAQIATFVEPIISQGKMLIADVLQKSMPFLEQFATSVLPLIMTLLTSVSSDILPLLLSALSVLMPPLIQIVESVFPMAISLINKLLPPLIQVVQTLLPPLIKMLEPLLRLLDPLIQLLDPILGLVVDLLDPLLNLINNLLIPLISVISLVISVALKPLREYFSLLSSTITGVVSNAIQNVIDGFNNLKKFLSEIIGFVKNVFTGNWKAAWQNVKNIFSSIASGLGTAFKSPINVIIGAINGFIRGLNKIKIPEWVPGVGGKGFNISQIPRLASGGVLEKGQVGLLEGSGAEAVVPLENNKKWISAVARDMDAVGGSQNSNVVALLTQILKLLTDLDDTLIDKFVTALLSTRFEVNNREFARLVKDYA